MKLYYVHQIKDQTCDECGYNGGKYDMNDTFYITRLEAEATASGSDGAVIFELDTTTLKTKILKEICFYKDNN